jgi:hypothetical protein
MLPKKSPGGATFPYYYKNGELFGAHYESFGERENELLTLMAAEEEFLIGRHYPLPYWVNFYGTKLSERVIGEFLQSMLRLQGFIPRLGVVGVSWMTKRRLEKERKRVGLAMPVRYFIDAEVAKTWLVGKIH